MGLSKEKLRLAADIGIILLISVFASYIVTQELIAKGATYWDNVFFYPVFWNQMDSLNRFGEFAWWFPSNQYGWPSFFYGVLGDIPCLTPVFACFAFAAWLLGRLGVTPSYFEFFTAYYGFVVPAILNIVVYFVARKFLVRRTSIFFAVVLSAFSPGLFVNMTDVGFIEPLIYSLVFFLAWLNYLGKPDRKNFWRLTLCTCIVALTATFPFLIWNFYFIPLTMLISILVPGGVERFKAAARSPELWQWGVFAVCAGICVAPSGLAVTNTVNFIRTTIGSEAYDWRKLSPGNPMEYLGMSLPSMGFEWDPGGIWRLKPSGMGMWTAYQYMGLMALPLSLIALVFGGRVWRMGAIIFVTVSALIITLSAHSPFFALLISSIRPLRSNSHWPDLGFRAGGFLLIIFLASYGFELLANGHRKASKAFPILAILSAALTYSLLWMFYENKMFQVPIVGVAVVLSILFVIVGTWLATGFAPRRRIVSILVLLALCTIDVATNLNLHMRMVMATMGYKAIARPEVAQQGSVGIVTMQHDYANHILTLRPLWEMQKQEFPVDGLWRGRLFNSAHSHAGDLTARVKEEKSLIAQLTQEKYYSIELEPEDINRPELDTFVKNPNPSAVGGALNLDFLSYNELHLTVQSSQKALLFLKDSFYPGWTATVGGEKVPIYRALFNFKAIPVPHGTSKVELRFKPKGLGIAMWSAYFVLAVLGIICLVPLLRDRRVSERRVRQRR